jgi:hypothetical protein
MSELSSEFLKMQLLHFQACERFFRAPLDLEMLKKRLSQKQEEEESGGSQGSSVSQQYTDFLLPLPEHLQPTEIGIPDPNVIQARRTEKGMNEPLRAQEKNIRNELKAKAELKNQFKNRPAPGSQPKLEQQYSRKLKIAPRPGGSSGRLEEG